MLTVITPTTGKESLLNSIESLKKQSSIIPIRHIMIWDQKREGEFLFPNELGEVNNIYDLECEENNYSSNCIVIKGNFVKGEAAGSALRSIGLMAADTEWVTFMDDDVMWESNHVETLLEAVKDREWGFCKRAIWNKEDNGEYNCFGTDNFESVGEEAKTPYKMVDNNCLIFRRKYGVSAACLYRNTERYNDDRLMYNFLMEYAGDPAKSNKATVNQVCPKKLVGFFKSNCTKEF